MASPPSPLRKHPLQKLNSPSFGISAVIHTAGLASFAASFKFLIDHPNVANEAYGWHFQYLTIIGLLLSTFTFAVGLASDLTLSCRLFQLKNLISVCSAPLEVLITVLYWSLKAIDEKLVVPEWSEQVLLADIGFHAIPTLALVIDILFLSPPWTIKAIHSLSLATSLAFGYWFWVEQCYRNNGWYPYPLFEQLTIPWRIALFMTSGILMALSTELLKCVYIRVNGSPVEKGTSVAGPDTKTRREHLN